MLQYVVLELKPIHNSLFSIESALKKQLLIFIFNRFTPWNRETIPTGPNTPGRETPALSANRNPEDAGRRRANKDTTAVERYLSRRPACQTAGRFTQINAEKFKYKEIREMEFL